MPCVSARPNSTAAYARRDELKNACEQCPVNDACHSAFGEVDGYGLFPFNQVALERAIRSQSADGKFVARNVLTRVLRPVLHRDQAEIDHGRFPSEGFASDFRTGADDRLANIEDQVKLRPPGDEDLNERRIRLVRFWGSGYGAENLALTIHSAFEVAPVEGLSADPEPPTPGPGPPPPPPPPIPPPPPRSEPTLVRAMDRWLATKAQDYRQGDINDLRNIVFNAVRSRLSFEDGFGGDSLWSNDKALAPGFEAKMVEFNQAKLATAVLPIDQSNADDMRALRALAWAHHKGSWVEVPDGEKLQRLAETRVEKWVSTVSAALLPPERVDADVELIRLTETLLTIARALGISDAFKSDAASKVRALFAPAPSRPDPDPRPGLRSLHAFLVHGAGSGTNVTRVSRAQLQQRLLRHASYSQGSGKPLALDVSKVTKVLRDGATGAAWPESTPELIRNSVSTLEARITSIDPLHQEAVSLVPDLSELGGDVVDVAAELVAFVNERGALGALPGGISSADLQAAAKAVKPNDQRKVETAFAELNRWDQLSTDERFQILNGEWDEPARRVNAWLQLATQSVRLLQYSLVSGTRSDVQREYADARDQLVEDLTAMADTIAGTPAPAYQSEDES